jgi:hypothetical protein
MQIKVLVLTLLNSMTYMCFPISYRVSLRVPGLVDRVLFTQNSAFLSPPPPPPYAPALPHASGSGSGSGASQSALGTIGSPSKNLVGLLYLHI